ncbi:hypothetical protein B2G88_15355 [Natronolimnobius baerhuensis]|uniref:Uncharacterized protein n=2 Tax=Natronolimnobius baerhuensis TaxID=253108 RepID=A0A202E692_9EURY|nr:hypothetical protein B2G88_15355 [Natronolimnobius baerhuensis]
MKPTFDATDTGLEIIDPIERRRYHLQTPRAVSPEPVEEHGIPFPIGTAAQIVTDEIVLPTMNRVLVRNKEGLMKAEVQSDDHAYFPHGTYNLDISGSLKVYAHINSSVYIYSDNEQTHISFDGETQCLIGARSFHRRPADTITTTTKPTDVMEAVSIFSSALKTTSAERSYPTLRGHPPMLEVGDELEIPDTLTELETGIEIVVPPKLQDIFVVTPLSYYLGATIRSGSEPQIMTESGYTYSLCGPDGFENTVKRVLKHIFVLDCVVRTEGPTPLPLYRRKAIEPLLEFDLEEMYSRPLHERVQAYLEVDSASIDEYYPNWRLETQVNAVAETIDFLPFLADELAIISIDEKTETPEPTKETVEAIDSFTRADFVRSASPIRGNQETPISDSDTADHPPQTTITQVWQSIHGTDINSTTPVSAYYNRIGRTPRPDPIEIEVVCNDAEMQDELESVNGFYGTHNRLPFNVSIHYDFTTAELKNTLATESDFFHYIGHIDREGFQCSDGKFDASTMDSVGVEAFLLNACQSHDQGLHLIDAGSIGGIVTLGDIVNSGAVKMGSVIAQLLNGGFPLYAALDVARIENIIGQQYLIVGDGRATIAQSETAMPDICLVRQGEDGYESNIIAYGEVRSSNGGVFTPDIDPIEDYYIIPDQTGWFPTDISQLGEFFDIGRFPVLFENQLYWSDTIEMDIL